MEHISTRIEAARDALGLSVTQLAEQAGIPRQTLSRRLLAPATFTLGELEQIATVLDTTAEALVLIEAA